MSLAAAIARRMLAAREAPARAAPQTNRENYKRPSERRPATPPAPPRASPPIVLPPRELEVPLPPPVLQAGWKGSCKAVNAATGRQCALLHGHEGHHRHGSTAFVTLALSDADVARARARLDDAAQSRRTNPMTA